MPRIKHIPPDIELLTLEPDSGFSLENLLAAASNFSKPVANKKIFTEVARNIYGDKNYNKVRDCLVNYLTDNDDRFNYNFLPPTEEYTHLKWNQWISYNGRDYIFESGYEFSKERNEETFYFMLRDGRKPLELVDGLSIALMHNNQRVSGAYNSDEKIPGVRGFFFLGKFLNELLIKNGIIEFSD